MTLEFDFLPHDINNMYQLIRYKTSFSRHLLYNTNNKNLWEKLVSIDSFSLCINKNDCINVVMDILQTLKYFVCFYTYYHKLKKQEIEEVYSYDTLLVYLKDKLKNGKQIKY